MPSPYSDDVPTQSLNPLNSGGLCDPVIWMPALTGGGAGSSTGAASAPRRCPPRGVPAATSPATSASRSATPLGRLSRPTATSSGTLALGEQRGERAADRLRGLHGEVLPHHPADVVLPEDSRRDQGAFAGVGGSRRHGRRGLVVPRPARRRTTARVRPAAPARPTRTSTTPREPPRRRRHRSRPPGRGFMNITRTTCR